MGVGLCIRTFNNLVLINNNNMNTKTLTQGVKAIRMTAEAVKADSARDYNPSIWERNVDSYSKYSDVEFYKVNRDEIYGYDRFYVVYTLPEGLRLLSDFGYSSSLTSGGFYLAYILTMDMEIDDNGSIVSCTMLEEGNVYINTMQVRSKSGEYGAMSNSSAARSKMIEHSKATKQIWTKEYLS
jgi:hypothetical protein